MKTKILATLALAAGVAGFASHANADTRINVSFGVVPAPVYTAAPVVVADNCAPTTTVVTAPVSYGYGNNNNNNNYSYRYNDRYNEPARGHWENVTRKVWVPERWVTSYNRWGRPVRVLEPGYFTVRTERVWIAYNDRGHNNNGYGYGYRG